MGDTNVYLFFTCKGIPLDEITENKQRRIHTISVIRYDGQLTDTQTV